MTEPTRWAENDADLTEEERRVLAAGLRPAEVPRNMQNAIWGALGRKLPLAAASSTVAATATKAAASLSLVKVGLTGVLLGSVATGAWVGGEHLLSSTAHSARPVPSAAAPRRALPRVEPPATSAAPIPALVPVPELPSPPVAHDRPSTTREPPSEAPRVDTRSTPGPAVAPERSVASFPLPAPAAPSAAGTAILESRRVADARALLRKGDARGALATLDGVRRDFPNGVLAQERDALTIEALLALGDRQRARELATAFLARYPGSPHRATVERALK